MEAGLDANSLQDSPLSVIEMSRKHAVARRLGKLGQEICQVGLKKHKNVYLKSEGKTSKYNPKRHRPLKSVQFNFINLLKDK